MRADKWIQKAGPDEIAKVVPESYLLGDPAVYKTAISKSLEGLSPDRLIPEDGAATALKALAAYQADFDAAKIDASKVWTNDFARRANEVPQWLKPRSPGKHQLHLCFPRRPLATLHRGQRHLPGHRAGEFVSVVGPTGCGKSTLLNVGAGLLAPSSGQVKVFGQPLSGINARAGYMFRARRCCRGAARWTT